MNSRLINLALRHSLFAAGTATAYTIYDEILGEKLRRERKFLSTTDKSDCNNGVNWKRDKIIIDQAFRDAGWQQPVYVAYHQVTTGVFTTKNDDATHSAYVLIKNEHFPYSDTRDLDLYAVMGHEAIHAVHNDGFRSQVVKGLALYLAAYASFRAAGKLEIHKLWLLPVISFTELPTFGMFLLFMAGLPQAYLGLTVYGSTYMVNTIASTAILPFKRYQEKRADKESATLLGTATGLADAIEKINMPHDFFDEHPSSAKRVAYLRKLESESAHTPKLFQSQAYSQLGKPEVVPCSCEDEKSGNDFKGYRALSGGGVIPN